MYNDQALSDLHSQQCAWCVVKGHPCYLTEWTDECSTYLAAKLMVPDFETLYFYLCNISYFLFHHIYQLPFPSLGEWRGEWFMADVEYRELIISNERREEGFSEAFLGSLENVKLMGIWCSLKYAELSRKASTGSKFHSWRNKPLGNLNSAINVPPHGWDRVSHYHQLWTGERPSEKMRSRGREAGRNEDKLGRGR